MKQTTKVILLIIALLFSEFLNAQNISFLSDSIRARELNVKANDLGKYGLHSQALDTFLASLNIRKNIYGNESPQLAPVFVGIGITYRALGQLDLALKYYKLAEENYLLHENYKNDPKRRLFVNIGNVYRNKFDYNKALQYFEQALQVYRQEEIILPEVVAAINYNIAETYYLTNKYEKAIELIRQNINSAYAEDQILYYELWAFINQVQGEMRNARKNYRKAIDLTIALNEKDHLNVAIAYLNYSLFLITNKHYKDANVALQNAYDILQSTKPLNNFVLSDYYKLQGYLSNKKPIETQNIASFKTQKKKNINDAITWTKKGLDALNFPEDYSVSTIEQSKNCLSLMDCINLLKIIGDNYAELAELEQSGSKTIFTESLANALETYQVVGALIQRARKEISDDESKMQLTALEYSTFYKLIESSYTAHFLTNDAKYLELAFQNAERIKGSSVFDKISEQMALENSLIPDSLLTLEQKLNNRIAEYTAKLQEESNMVTPDSVLLSEYSDKIFKATRQREELNSYMEREYNDYYELKYSKAMFTLHEVQQKLKENQVIFEFVLNESDTINALYTFIISKQNLSFNKQVLDNAFLNEIETVYHFMSNPNFLLTTNQESIDFCVASNALYNNLISPFSVQIQNKSLIIVPDGKLNYLPFEALLEDLPDTAKTVEFNQLAYLIHNYSINYSNSVNLLFRNKESPFKSRKKALVFAPKYNGEKIVVEGENLFLTPLPGIKKEVRLISRIIKSKVFEEEEATEYNFRKNAEQYDILHLAMHAFINDSVPAFSSLAFTQVETDDLQKEGLLNTLDIYNLKLKAKLAVLSACNTGTGQLRKGEGIMSLARGFLYAGCPSIIMSLWEVDDESGTKIMASFYKNLKKGESKDEALRMAKLEYLASVNSRKAHPHYWLSFVSIGDNSPMYISYDFYFFLFLILALLGIGLDQIMRIKKARKKRAF